MAGVAVWSGRWFVLVCVLVRIAEARTVLSTAFTTQIQQVFTRAHASDTADGVAAALARSGLPRFRAGDDPAGHDPTRVPRVPAAEVEIQRRADDDARIWFSYKVEYGWPPNPVLHVRRNWLSVVARPGHVLLDGWVVLDVVERDPGGRPATIRTAVVGGFYDGSMHGWRAHAETYDARVHWHHDHPDIPTVELGRFIA